MIKQVIKKSDSIFHIIKSIVQIDKAFSSFQLSD